MEMDLMETGLIDIGGMETGGIDTGGMLTSTRRSGGGVAIGIEAWISRVKGDREVGVGEAAERRGSSKMLRRGSGSIIAR